MKFEYDIIVVGAGHAGCEAARIAAHLGSSVLLITIDMEKIAQMSCNPAIGGIAKGQIVREIDALGGFSAVATDRSSIQFRMLNRSKGPAMWSPRAQCDRMVFSRLWRRELEQTERLTIWQDNVIELLLSKDGSEVTGIKTQLGVRFYAPRVILANGTFLNGLMHVGKVQIEGGRISEPTSKGLSAQLASLGYRVDRMKTGTPMRLDGRSIHFDLCQEQAGEGSDGTWQHHFSFDPQVSNRELPQRSCFITYTNKEVHQLLHDHLDQSPLYNGQIQSIGPRYCPSIETKITTFADKESHQLFIEPEGAETTEYYLNGFSSSMPYEIQVEALRLIPALKDAAILRPGYAIEYDFFDPTQLHHTMETKLTKGLYFAGQINGTTGYEEAAGQGLMAGINAHLSLAETDPFVLQRDEAYIGVMIDDLVTKGVDEPYRMFTSRAEYRILLRQDNADLRLSPQAIRLELLRPHQVEYFTTKMEAKQKMIQLLKNQSIAPDTAPLTSSATDSAHTFNTLLEANGSTPIKQKTKASDLLLRPEISIGDLLPYLPYTALLPEEGTAPFAFEELAEAVEIEIKYAGYIERERQLAEKAKRLEEIRIRGHFNYSTIHALSTEARQKLERIDPETIGQASRIPGISPSDINILLVLLGR